MNMYIYLYLYIYSISCFHILHMYNRVHYIYIKVYISPIEHTKSNNTHSKLYVHICANKSTYIQHICSNTSMPNLARAAATREGGGLVDGKADAARRSGRCKSMPGVHAVSRMRLWPHSPRARVIQHQKALSCVARCDDANCLVRRSSSPLQVCRRHDLACDLRGRVCFDRLCILAAPAPSHE